MILRGLKVIVFLSFMCQEPPKTLQVTALDFKAQYLGTWTPQVLQKGFIIFCTRTLGTGLHSDCEGLHASCSFTSLLHTFLGVGHVRLKHFSGCAECSLANPGAPVYK